MTFERFLELTPKIANSPLPGEPAHYEMAPLIRKKELEKVKATGIKARKASVMMLVYPDDKGEAHFILILRKTYKGVHSGQVGFPGGKAEPQDESDMETALRETEEEIGVPAKLIKPVCHFSKIFIPPSNFYVYPFMGYIPERIDFIPQESEVEAILEIPLQDLLDDSTVISQKLSTSYAIDIEVPAFKLAGLTVWGATAMMLSEIKQVVSSVATKQ